MEPATTQFRAFEGRQVGAALADGSHLDDCHLVSAGGEETKTVWLVIGHMDACLFKSDIVAMWEEIA